VIIQLDEILDEETRSKVYEYNLLMLSMNTHREMQIWLYIILVAGQLEYGYFWETHPKGKITVLITP
jgi:hypothetical protein